MAYYCGECIVWRGSNDENRYGERWCSFSRRYEKSDQNTYGCKGFLYAGRAVLTKACEILEMNPQPWFDSFDHVKDEYLVPDQFELLMDYCDIGPVIAKRLEKDVDKVSVSRQLMQDYLVPAKNFESAERFSDAVGLYQQMIKQMRSRYSI